MFCDKKKCKKDKCKFWMKMYMPNPEDKETPIEEQDCVFMWQNVLLSEISSKLGGLLQYIGDKDKPKED